MAKIQFLLPLVFPIVSRPTTVPLVPTPLAVLDVTFPFAVKMFYLNSNDGV